ncbi:MAG: universal stress protein [Planctomycetaceae bacterium]|nr:universal stress protein [Planctomycetaceae bacterium]
MTSQSRVSMQNIVHPTDFSHGSDIAFAHALKLTLCSAGDLEILHVDRGREDGDWSRYPSVRSVLARWDILPDNADKRDVARLGVNISKSACSDTSTATGVLEHINRRDADLVVLATHRRSGVDRWMHGRVAEYVANRCCASTLFVPYGVDGFISLDCGDVSLSRILIPVDVTPDPQVAIDAAVMLADAVAAEPVEVELLHVGDPASMPGLRLPDSDVCRWRWTTVPGDTVETICRTAEQQDSDLVIMTTNGHDGFLDALRGSTSERVLQRLRCPLLSVH